MKVLLVVPSYDPIVGGAETLSRQIATHLNASGIHADIMTFHMNSRWKPFLTQTVQRGNFAVFRVAAIANPFALLPINPIHLLFRINVLPRLSFTKLFRDYDVIHYLDEEDLSFPLFSFFVKKPKIMHLLTPIAFEAIRRNFFQRQVFKRIASGYIPDPFQRRFLIQMGIASSKIAAMDTVGIDVRTFKPDESKRLDFMVLFVGRLQRLKGIQVLLRSLAFLKIPVNLVLIGPCDKNDTEFSNDVENMVHSINAQRFHKVELLGCMSEKELVNWYQKATLLVTPHLDGTAGLTTLEALASATPVVATGTLVVKNGVDGFVVPPNDAEKLGKAMEALLGNKELRRKFGLEGRRIIEEHYSWDKITKDLNRVYERALRNA